MGKAVSTMLENTLVYFRFTPGPTIPSMLVWATVNSAVRLGVIYISIRVVMTAVAHGSL